MADAPPSLVRTVLLRRLVLTVLIVGSLAGIGLAGTMAVTGSDTAEDGLPAFVDRVFPLPGAEVPRQSLVGIDVAEGFDAYLVVNGNELRTTDDGLIRDLGTGVVQFQPAPGMVIEAFEPGENCVLAFVWNQLEQETSAVAVPWCFEAY